MKVYAECNIVIWPVLEAKQTRKRMAEVDVKVFSSQSAGIPQPITLIVKGANFVRIMELMAVYRKTDEELAEGVRASILASEVEEMTDEEAAAWARGNIVSEIQEMERAE